MNPRLTRGVVLLALGLVALLARPGSAAESPSPPDVPLLVLLSDTGELRGELPVVTVEAEAEDTLRALGRGLPGTLLRVYRWVQVYRHAHEGIEIEPAYVLLSERQGGFAREGFVLAGIEKSSVGYVDVHREWPITGEFGALDQIVPHEMAHVIRRQLAGPLADGGTNQVHALTLKTDPVTAFNEGFAEHFQPMAIDHPDADPATRELADDRTAYANARRRLAAYGREVSARLAVAPRLRMGFVAWFSNDEDVLRHFAVKENVFAREPDLPERLLGRDDLYAAYLLENILLGEPAGEAKSMRRMLSSEGVVSTLFYRWANHEGIRQTRREDDFYAAFGALPTDVSPLENVYLKLFEVFYLTKPQGVLDLFEGYRDRFPDEGSFIDELVDDVFLGQTVEPAAEIWLANTALQTGTTLFDQYRGLPRTHTFDLNSASLVDLASVPGVDAAVARAIHDAAPFDALEDLSAVPGLDPDSLERFRGMRHEMEAMRAAAEEQSVEDVLSIQTILMPYAWRALAVLISATALGALVFFRIRRADETWRPGRIRAALAGLGATLLALAFGWAIGSGVAALVAVAVVFGLPAAIWRMWRTRRRSAALNIFVAWEAAALPALGLITPWL